MKRVTVIDYGLSNLLSVRRALEHCGAQVVVTGERGEIERAENLVLPGVGAFADGMAGLRSLGLAELLREKAAKGAPLLGICLGMQMLFGESLEFGRHEGLGLIPGRVERIPGEDARGGKQRVPHIGWNALIPNEARQLRGTVLDGFPSGAEVYFVHSFEAKPDKASSALAHTLYGGREICAVAANEEGNVVGCQFHPEKSGEAGLAILRAFLAGCG